MSIPTATSEASSPGPNLAASSRFIFGVTILASAFLLFQVQLIVSKSLLPWFGGSSAVWATSMVFYQAALLAGYLAAHLLARLPMRWQGWWHLVILGGAAAFIAIGRWQGIAIVADARYRPGPGVQANPIGALLLRLAVSAGIPLVTLAMTAPLLQSWYARLHGSQAKRSPYFLYALSNGGSLLGLLSYPPLFEPFLRLSVQARVWSAGFVFFLICSASCAANALRSRAPAEAAVGKAGQRPARATYALWCGLAATGSVLLLATTNLLTQDLAPIPLLWVLPLAVYLLTFVLAFSPIKLYWPAFQHPLFALGCLLGTVALFEGTYMALRPQIIILLFVLFAACLVLHGELARLRPEPAHLTSFYLMIAAGGAGGGLLVGIAAPLWLPAIWEYHLGLYAAALLIALLIWSDRGSWLHSSRPHPLLPSMVLWAIAAAGWYLARVGVISLTPDMQLNYLGGLVLAAMAMIYALFHGVPAWLRQPRLRWHAIALFGGVIALGGALLRQATTADGTLLHRERNFYGALAVRSQTDNGLEYTELMHGRITHGLQIRRQPDFPTSYYGHQSGAGLALLRHPQRGRGELKVGAIGLGVGTVAAYAREGDEYRFYEINPAVIRLARGEGHFFSFLTNAKGNVSIVPGDARLSLESEAQAGRRQGFDVLIVDAFNGDSIPVHLLTREAFALYLQHLRGPDSIIAVHISNIALDLRPVLAGVAQEFHLQAMLVDTDATSETLLASHWVLLSRQPFTQPEFRGRGIPMLRTVFGPKPPLWTDDYSNVIQLLDWDSD